MILKIPQLSTQCPKKKADSNNLGLLSAAKAALDMQMSVSQSVSQSVSLSVTLIFLTDLLVYFIIANRTEMELKQFLCITRQ